MSIQRWATKIDSTQTAIVEGLRQVGVRVWIIRQPCDLLCYLWSNPLQRFIWQTLEVKTPYGKRNPKAKMDARQRNQTKFLAETQTPVVTCLEDALIALGLVPNPVTSVTCTSKPLSGPASSAVGQ